MSDFLKKLKSIIGKTYFKYLVILIAFIFWMTFLDTNSLLIHAELNREIKKLKKRKDALTEEIVKDQGLIKRLENIKIPKDFNYIKLSSLSSEAKEKLVRINPQTISQASRISGINPSDISVLLVSLGR